MKAALRIPAALALLTAAFGAGLDAGAQMDDSWIAGSFLATDARIRVETEERPTPGVASLEVKATAQGASVAVNKIEVGDAPYSADDLDPGTYLIEVEAKGYRGLSLSIALSEKTRYTLTFDLELLTGFLVLGVKPADAVARIGETRIPIGRSELPIGTYELVVSRFGYREARTVFRIHDGSSTRLDIDLEEAPFEISDFRSTRRSFNPRNPGAPGRTEFAFSATNRGTATVVVTGPDGAEVARIEYPPFQTWQQSAGWDGKSSGGEALPDGLYAVRLTARPAPGVPVPVPGSGGGSDPVSRETSVSIDSSLVVRAIGSASALPGLLHFPDSRPLPRGTVAAETWIFAPLDGVERSATGFSGAFAPADGSMLSLSSAVELGGAEEEAGSGAGGGAALGAAASFSQSLIRDPEAPLSAAVFLRAAFDAAASPSLPGSRDGIEVSVPLALHLGSRSAGFSLGASGGFFLDLASDSPLPGAIARAGAWGELPIGRAGLSGELAFVAAGGSLAPAWPARVSAEARLMLAPSPFVAALHAGAELEPGASTRFFAGLGLGLLF